MVYFNVVFTQKYPTRKDKIDFSKKILKELLLCTKLCSFNLMEGIIGKQILLLSRTFASISLAQLVTIKPKDAIKQTSVYLRYIDDNFIVYNNSDYSDRPLRSFSFAHLYPK